MKNDPAWLQDFHDPTFGPMMPLTAEDLPPVPSVRDALGQHLTARVLLRAGYVSRPPYHPERSSP